MIFLGKLYECDFFGMWLMFVPIFFGEWGFMMYFSVTVPDGEMAGRYGLLNCMICILFLRSGRNAHKHVHNGIRNFFRMCPTNQIC